MKSTASPNARKVRASASARPKLNPPASRPAPSAERRTETVPPLVPRSREAEPERRESLWLAVARSKLNRDAVTILAAVEQALALAERFLETHDENSLLDELRKKGLVPSDGSSFGSLAAHAIHDIRGLTYNLESFISFIGSELLGRQYPNGYIALDYSVTEEGRRALAEAEAAGKVAPRKPR